MSRRTITAHYTEPSEYVEELQRDKELVERGLVRVSNTAERDATGALTHVLVESSAIIEGRVVRLEVYCGTLWGVEVADRAVQHRAGELVDSLESELRLAGLEIRGGLWCDQ